MKMKNGIQLREILGILIIICLLVSHITNLYLRNENDGLIQRLAENEKGIINVQVITFNKVTLETKAENFELEGIADYSNIAFKYAPEPHLKSILSIEIVKE